MSGLLATIVSVLAVLSGLGAAAAFLAIGRQRGRVAVLEASGNDLRNDVVDRDRRILFLEEQNKRGEKESARQAREISSLHEQVETLSRVVTGEAHYAALHDQVDALRAAVMNELTAITNSQRDLLAIQGSSRTGDGA